MKIKCTCKHEQQDKLNNGLRIANPTTKDYVRCTVCGKEHKVGIK